MNRSVFFLFLFLLFPLSPAMAQTDGEFECRTCEENCEALGFEFGERVCIVHGDGDDSIQVPTADADGDGDADGDEATNFQTALVQWEYVPIIQARSATGAVSKVDAQRTLQADLTGIASCFSPSGYPGVGYVDVDLHLGYNGIPQAVNGSPEGISPNQARCILRRAWSYEFPRLAESADAPSKIEYRVEFAVQRRGMPDADNRPQLLLEAIRVSHRPLAPQVSAGLFAALPSIQRCAALSAEDLPMDLVVAEVQIGWTRADEDRFTPADLDITVTNQTGTERVSQEALDCFQDHLSRWDLELDEDEVSKLDASFFLTIRPAGWIDS